MGYGHLPNTVNVNANLKKIDISVSIAQTENVFLLWVFRDGLDNAVLSKQDIAWGHFLLWAALPISLTQKEHAACWRTEQCVTGNDGAVMTVQ